MVAMAIFRSDRKGVDPYGSRDTELDLFRYAVPVRFRYTPVLHVTDMLSLLHFQSPLAPSDIPGARRPSC